MPECPTVDLLTRVARIALPGLFCTEVQDKQIGVHKNSDLRVRQTAVQRYIRKL